MNTLEYVEESLQRAKRYRMEVVVFYLEALKAVLELHKPFRAIYGADGVLIEEYCEGCTYLEATRPYPCPTVTAIEKALGGRE